MKDNFFYWLIIIIAILVAVFLQKRNVTGDPLQPKLHHGRVAWVKDGDSLRLDGLKQDLRLWGVDAAEKGEQGADAARNTLITLTKGKRISYIEVDRDRYGRIVARVFLKDGREVNRMMIESGAAVEYCKYSKGFYGRC